ncbi:MAG: CHAT domain-containing protein [Blastocatellia bacterium]
MTRQYNSPRCSLDRPRLLARATILLIVAWVVAIGVERRPAHAQDKLPLLQAGAIVEQRLAGGEMSAFHIPLITGHFARLRVNQHGIDVELHIIDPAGQKLVEMDTLNSTQGSEVAAVIAELPGLYRIEIVSPNKSVPAGQYVLQVEALRMVTESDREWHDAQRAYLAGRSLRLQQAAEAKREAVPRLETALRKWQAMDDRLMATHTLYSISSVYRQLGQPQQALAHLQQALRLVRSIGERTEEAPTLTNLGIVHTELGEPRKSLEYYDQALRQWQALGDTYGEARTYTNQGLAYTLLGEGTKALESYGRGNLVWQKLGNTLQAADTLTSIGRAYEILGERQKSLESYDQSLTLYHFISNRRGEAFALNNIGVVYGRLGEVRKELEYYNRALDLWRSIGNRREEANTLINIGSAETSLSNPKTAMTHYEKALLLWREAGDRRGEAITLQLIGDLQALSPEPRKSLDYYDRALPLLVTVGDRWREACVLRNLGYLHTTLSEPQKAVEYSNQALTIFRSIGDRSGESQTLYGIARAERDRGNLAEARQQIEKAIALVEAVRADVGNRQLRASYLASVQKYYELQIDLLMRFDRANPGKGFDALAVETSERARARGLLEILAESGANIREGADAALLDRERDLAQQLNAKAVTLTQLTSRPHKAEQAEALKFEISQLESEYEKTQATIRRASPHYAAITQPQPLSLREIQQQLDDDSLLLEYSLGEERGFLWAITNRAITTYELPNQARINQAARQVYDLLTARGPRRRNETSLQQRERIAQADTQLPEAARQLSQLILAPAASLLGDKRLIVVADGALQYVPFAALPKPGAGGWGLGAGKRNPQPPIPNPQPLVVDHEIIVLPSASALAAQRRELAGRPPAPKLLAVIADPVFSSKDDRTRRGRAGAQEVAGTRDIVHEEEEAAVTVGRFAIPRLPFTRQEAERILAIAPGAANLKALDFKANRATALDAELGQYRYVHFATHGLVDSERPGLSALVLSLVDEQGKPREGFLRAQEIYNLRLPADLVVLSACQTGLGKEIKGEGVVGLTRGFMYAGAARVVVSLWSVNDRATSELMVKFYQKMLKENRRPAEALRAAQVELLRQKQWQSPYFWAAFVLQGEWK